MRSIDNITGEILDAAIKIHRDFGPGMLKSTEKMSMVYHKQVKTYLKITGLQVGLLINFGMATLKEGFVRVVNGLDPHDSILNVNLRLSTSPREVNQGTPL